MATYRLNETHPAMQKLQQVFNLMDDLCITIGFESVTITVEHNGKTYYMLDNEMATMYNPGIGELPPCCEYKLVYQKDE